MSDARLSNAIQHVTCSGYLMKKTKNDKWQKRWFETNGCFLTYYKVIIKQNCCPGKIISHLNMNHSCQNYMAIVKENVEIISCAESPPSG
jgi:hypothetical protein